MAGTVPYFYGGGFSAFGIYRPTGNSVAGLAALVTAYPTIGNITITANQFYTVWNGPNDTNGFDGSVTAASGTLYQGTSGFMSVGVGTTTIAFGAGGYPVLTGPGAYGQGVAWKVGAIFCCAPGGAGCLGNVYNLGQCFSGGTLYMFPPPPIPGYYYDSGWNIQALPLSGFPPGTYPDPVTLHPVIPVVLNDPGQPPPPGPPPVIAPPAPLPGNPPPPGIDGTLPINPPGTINWRLHRCDFKPRPEEKA